MNIGDNIGEYIDYLRLREEYHAILKSTVADIKNISYTVRSDCMIAAAFLSHFVNDSIPWIHIDLGGITYTDSKAMSHGIHLLYEFIKQI